MAPLGSEQVTSAFPSSCSLVNERLRTNQFRVVDCLLDGAPLPMDSHQIADDTNNLLFVAVHAQDQGNGADSPKEAAQGQIFYGAEPPVGLSKIATSHLLAVQRLTNQITIDNTLIKCHTHPAIQSAVSSREFRAYRITLKAHASKMHREVALMLGTNGLLVSLSSCRVFFENFAPKDAASSAAEFEASFHRQNVVQGQVLPVHRGLLKLGFGAGHFNGNQEEMDDDDDDQRVHEFFLIEVY